MEYKGIPYMRRKLESKRTRVLTRYEYYDGKNKVKYFASLMPENYRWMAGALGWCSKAVDNLADRLTFNKFRNDNFNLNDIFAQNNADIFLDSSILSALIGSCCFEYISSDKDGSPRIRVIDGANATGNIDPITGLLTEGYAVLERSDAGTPLLEAYFTAKSTVFFGKGQQTLAVKNPTGYPLLVPVIYRPDATRPFGHSRITRGCMAQMQGALRTIWRSEVAAEFYSFPQKYVLGLADDSEFNSQKANMSTFLSFGKDDEGDKPQVGQFSQQSMAPHIEQLRSFASLFAGEAGLTMDDMGFPSDNPSSADAIKTAHDTLRLTAKKAQRSLGVGLLNTGFVAACLRDKRQYLRRQIYLTSPSWYPIFEPDSSSMSGLGDAILKINQAVPGYISEEIMQDLLGF